MMIPLMDERNCFVACDAETVSRGACSCYNRVTSAVNDGCDVNLLKLRGGKQRLFLSKPNTEEE